MGRTLQLAWVILFLGGCATGPRFENPFPVRPVPATFTENPVYIPQGPRAYRLVFDKTLDILDDYFTIAYANLYDGRIETHPVISPGLEQAWKPGSPDFYQRLLASFQTIRHRAIVLIRTADDGGYWVDVKVLKELEDLAQPSQARTGAAIFRLDSPIERQFEIIEPTLFERTWIPIGRDHELEQVILTCLADFDLSAPIVPDAYAEP
jgi:hypothetical protein